MSRAFQTRRKQHAGRDALEDRRTATLLARVFALRARDEKSAERSPLHANDIPGASDRIAACSRNIADPDPARGSRTHALLSELAAGLGLDGSSVRVRVDDTARAVTGARGALGLMQDGVVYLNPERYDPETRAGRYLLAHEVAHVAQRSQTASLASVAPAARAAEIEATTIGRAFAVGGTVKPVTQTLGPMAIAAEETEFGEDQARQEDQEQAHDEESASDLDTETLYWEEVEALIEAVCPELSGARFERIMLLTEKWPPEAGWTEEDVLECVEDIDVSSETEGDMFDLFDRYELMREAPAAFPEAWADEVYDALSLDVDLGAIIDERVTEEELLTAIAERLPPELHEAGLPVEFAEALELQGFQLELGHADMEREHIVREYARQAVSYTRATVIATFYQTWEDAVFGASEAIRNEELVVPTESFDAFIDNHAELLSELPGRISDLLTGADLESLDADVNVIAEAELALALFSGLASLLSILGSFTTAMDTFDAKMGEADELVGGEDEWLRVQRALTWAYEAGYLGAAAEQLWAAVTEHGWVILLSLLGFIAVQYVPILNVAVDVVLLIITGVDLLDAVMSLAAAVESARSAGSIVGLQRAAAVLGQSVVGDGLRIILDLIGIAASVAAIRAHAKALMAADPKLTEAQAIERALLDPELSAEAAMVQSYRDVQAFLAAHGNSAAARRALQLARGELEVAEVVHKVLLREAVTEAERAILGAALPDLLEVVVTLDTLAAKGLETRGAHAQLTHSGLATSEQGTFALRLRQLADEAPLTQSQLDRVMKADNPNTIGRALDEWLRETTAAKFLEYVERYSMETVGYYGREFLTTFQGATQRTIDHIAVFDRIKKGAISGTHDEATFLQLFDPPQPCGELQGATAHPVDGRIVKRDYRMYKRKKGASPKDPAAVELPATLSDRTIDPKTTIAGLATDIDHWTRMATEACEDAMKRRTLPKGGGFFQGKTSTGLEIAGYVRETPPFIKTFYVVW